MSDKYAADQTGSINKIYKIGSGFWGLVLIRLRNSKASHQDLMENNNY